MGSYALGQLKLLFVLCLFRHKKVNAWFMHLFCELDGNCLCFGAPDGSKHEIWKWNSVHELIYKVEQVLSCRIGSSWINTTLCVWVSQTCLSLPCPIILRKMSVEANICKHACHVCGHHWVKTSRKVHVYTYLCGCLLTLYSMSPSDASISPDTTAHCVWDMYSLTWQLTGERHRWVSTS